MDIFTELLEHIQDVIDMKHLGEQLQSKPVVAGDGEWGWRAMREDEALAVANLVGEAVGLRWAAKIAPLDLLSDEAVE